MNDNLSFDNIAVSTKSHNNISLLTQFSLMAYSVVLLGSATAVSIFFLYFLAKMFGSSSKNQFDVKGKVHTYSSCMVRTQC